MMIEGTMCAKNRRQKMIDRIKSVVMEEVGDAVLGGYGGVFIDIHFCDCVADEIRSWVSDYYNCGDNYIDWKRDDKYGFGVGYNMYRCLNDGGISFDWNGVYDICGYKCEVETAGG